MKTLAGQLFAGMLVLVTSSACALAQTPSGAAARLKEKNITLPSLPAPVGNYVNAVQVGNLLFVSGNSGGPQWQHKGKVGKDVSIEDGYAAARQVGLIALAEVQGALGSLDRVKRVVNVLGMVNSAEGFGEQPRVINGFSDLMVDVFGETIGKHARSAVGVAALPGNAPVEVEMILEVE
jgi:enamine deaminase RidA (YjgF/YER057c/UK114 family)